MKPLKLPFILTILASCCCIISTAAEGEKFTRIMTADGIQEVTETTKRMTKPFGAFRALPSRGADYTVTCQLKFDQTTDYCSGGYCFRTDEAEAYDLSMVEDDEISEQLPQGIYDFWFMFSSYIGGPTRLVIKENVEVNGDMSLTFDSQEPNVPVSFNLLLPDGTPMVADSYDYETGTTVKGTVGTIAGDCIIVHKPTGFGAYFFGIPEFLSTDSQAPAFAAAFVAGSEAGTYAGNLFANDMHSGPFSNNPDNYRHVESLFHSSRFVYDPEIDPEPFGFSNIERIWFGSYQLGWNGKAVIGTGQRAYDVSWNKKDVYICTTFAESRDANDKSEFSFIPANYEWESFGDYTINGPFVESENGRVTYEVRHNPLFEFNNALDRWWNNDADHPTAGWCNGAHPRFSFDYDEGDTNIFGYNCPITVLGLGYVFDTNLGVGANFIGRYGENRIIDYMRATIDVRKDGQTVISDWQNTTMTEAGNYEVEITNKNAVTCGIPACNKSVSKFSFDPASDNTFSTLQMLQFRDDNDKITDNFMTADQGKLEFAGGSFKFRGTGDWMKGWFEEVPGYDVKVEYSPFGAEDYLPLEVEEVADYHMMSGYGSFYRCGLSAVNREAKFGAFDLRITLTGADGTSQVQTISPAFIVNMLRDWSELETISAETEAFEYPCQVYSFDGLLINGSADSSDIDALAPGLYILRSGTISRKHLVK